MGHPVGGVVGSKPRIALSIAQTVTAEAARKRNAERRGRAKATGAPRNNRAYYGVALARNQSRFLGDAIRQCAGLGKFGLFKTTQ